MSKKNFRIVTFTLLFVGLGLMILSMVLNDQTTKNILLGGTATCYIAAALQIIVYKNRPKAFEDKNEGANGDSSARTDIK